MLLMTRQVPRHAVRHADTGSAFADGANDFHDAAEKALYEDASGVYNRKGKSSGESRPCKFQIGFDFLLTVSDNGI